jgi:cytoskeleton protein RodZ
MSQDDAQPVIEDDAAAPDREPSIGERLRAAREAQPLSLTQISAALRIEPRFLTALEENRLEDFPAPVFAKGFLKQYGNLLGLNERDLLAQYYRQADVRDAPVVHHKPIRLRDDDQVRHWVAGAVVLCLIGGGIAAWWISQPVVEPVIVERATGPAPARSAPAPTPTVEPVRDEFALDSAVPPDVPAVVDPLIESPVADEASIGVAAVQIELNFAEDCWTEISDAQGERLFYGLGSAGSRAHFDATLPISIFFGNAGGVELTLNGNPYAIPAGSRQGNLARFVIAEPGP